MCTVAEVQEEDLYSTLYVFTIGQQAMSAASQEEQPPSVPSKDEDPNVEFVLTFVAKDAKLIKAKKQPSKSEIQARSEEFDRLVKAIRLVGLQVTARASMKNEGQILLFVHTPEETLVACGKLERLHDYLHGVKTAVEPEHTSSLSRSSSLGKQGVQGQADLFTSAERVRYAYELLTRPKPQGADIRVESAQYPHLKDMTPLHDSTFNREWLKRWSNVKSMLQIGVDELDTIKNHFGEHIALYFGFLNFYFQSLASMAAAGLAFWAAGSPFHPIYSLILVAWSCVFVELWRMKERKLAVRWGTSGVAHVDARRPDFKARTTRKDPATGEDQEVFEWWRREVRIACSIPVMFFFAALLVATMTTMFVTEVFVSKLYNGPGKQVVPFVPTALFVVCVPQIMGAWQATAAALTSWENHYSTRTHQSAMTIKMFALQAVVAYGALTLSAFVYIPFGQSIMDFIVTQGFFADHLNAAQARGDVKRNANGSIQFDINPSRMHGQLFAVLTTSQVINAFTETALPFILHKVNDYMASRKQSDAPSSTTSKAASNSSESSFLHRVEDQLSLPAYDTFGDYAEMATQFGYIALWSTIWPLAPVMAFINNFFELRLDALKMTIDARRPVPIRAESIGPWLEVLGFISWLSAMLNASLIYLFQPSPQAHLAGHSPYETVLRSHLHPGGESGRVHGTTPGKIVDSIVYPSDPANTARSPLSFSNLLPSYLPTSGTAGAVIASILLALAAEHVYGILRAAVRHVLDRALWRGSAEEIILRRREWQNRQEALERTGASVQAKEAVKAASPSRVGAPQQHGFWRSVEYDAQAVFEGAAKSE
jgi:hypothetical protein